MARAMLKPKPERGKRTDLSQDREKLGKTETNLLSQARFILHHDKALAQSVMNGSHKSFRFRND